MSYRYHADTEHQKHREYANGQRYTRNECPSNFPRHASPADSHDHVSSNTGVPAFGDGRHYRGSREYPRRMRESSFPLNNSTTVSTSSSFSAPYTSSADMTTGNQAYGRPSHGGKTRASAPSIRSKKGSTYTSDPAYPARTTGDRTLYDREVYTPVTRPSVSSTPSTFSSPYTPARELNATNRPTSRAMYSNAPQITVDDSPYDKSNYQMIKEGGWDNQKDFMESHGLRLWNPEDFDTARELLDGYRNVDAQNARSEVEEFEDVAPRYQDRYRDGVYQDDEDDDDDDYITPNGGEYDDRICERDETPPENYASDCEAYEYHVDYTDGKNFDDGGAGYGSRHGEYGGQEQGEDPTGSRCEIDEAAYEEPTETTYAGGMGLVVEEVSDAEATDEVALSAAEPLDEESGVAGPVEEGPADEVEVEDEDEDSDGVDDEGGDDYIVSDNDQDGEDYDCDYDDADENDYYVD